MKTIFLDQPFALRLADTEPPVQSNDPDEAIVRVQAVGICGTDLHAFQGNQAFFSYPRILGHELGVEVVAVGANAGQYGLAVGDHCAVMPYLSCGKCVACRRGKTNCCTQMQVLGVHVDGGMREWLALPMHTLRPANHLPYNQLAQVEMLAIGAHAVRRAQLEPGENVLVIGAGPIGLGTAAFAVAAGARVILQEVSPHRLDFCRRLEMTEVIDGSADGPAQLQDLLGEMPTAVFDATGNAASMMKSVASVAHGGRLIYVGHTKGDLTFSNPELHKRELTLLCSRNATAEDFTNVLNALTHQQVQPEPWITHQATFDSLVTDFPGWIDPANGVIKAILQA